MAVINKVLLGSITLAGSATDTYTLSASPLTVNVQQDTVRVACATTGTGTVVGATLPEISTYNGNYGDTKIVFFDSTGAAATNNITITAGGTDKIEGASTLVISTNNQAKTLTILGDGKWGVE